MRIFQVTNDAKVTFKNINFLNGWATNYDYGGAINIYYNVKVTIIDCTFMGNIAEDQGGAINTYEGGAIDIVNCIFTNNTAGMDGGAICTNENIIVKNTTFMNNKVEGGIAIRQRHGGAICCQKELGTINVEVDNCTFIGNHAEDYGGAIYADTITWTNNLHISLEIMLMIIKVVQYIQINSKLM